MVDNGAKVNPAQLNIRILYIYTVFGYSASNSSLRCRKTQSSPSDSWLGASKMKTLQKWFDQIAGVAEGEQERLARAREIFSDEMADVSNLEIPACWRRRSRIGQR